MGKFSILTATCNQADYIADCIQSVIDQKHDDWEMIIVDDCSKDNTFKIAQEFSSDRIKVYRNEKKLYCGMNYSKILSLATGEYCGVLDGDDKLTKDAMSTVVKRYRRNPDVDFIWTEHMWGNTKMDKFRNGLSRHAKRRTIYDSEGASLKHVYSHWRTFRTYMRDRGQLFRDLKCTVDKDLGYTLEELGQGAFLRRPLYLYRYHPKNMSHNSSQKAMWKEIRKYHKNKTRRYRIVQV